MEAEIDFDTLKTQLYQARFENELEYLKNNDVFNLFENHQEHDKESRIQQLELIISGAAHLGQSSIQHKRDELFKEIDKHIYRKLWNKLIAIHKIVKIKEYIKETYGEGPLQTTIIDQMSKCAEEGKINTKKSVIYDPNAEKILSIPVLTVDVQKNTYNIKLV